MKSLSFEKSSSSRFAGRVAQELITNHKLAASILKTLIYFDVFSYPLTSEEILNFIAYKNINKEEGIKTLENLKEYGLINFNSGYFLIGDNFEKITRRVAGNNLANKRMKKARFYSAIIASFPFTRGVFISGSLSKGYMDENSDIDYFIITCPNRLWVSRTFLILFKKLFLLNSHRNFCINYLVDTDNMEIQQRNIYTATEVALLIPMHNVKLFGQFMKANDWIIDYFPNYHPVTVKSVQGIIIMKKFLEKLLNNQLGDALDNFFYKTTIHFWMNKHGNEEIDRSDSDFLWNKHVAQYNPGHFRHSILSQFRNKIADFEKQTGFIIGEV